MSVGLRVAVLAAVLAAGAATFYLFGPIDAGSADGLICRRDALRAMAVANPVGSFLTYIATYVLAAALGLPLTAALSLLGGFLFGRWLGTVGTLAAATSGALILFYLARTAVGASLRERAGGRYRALTKMVRANAFAYIVFARVVPAFPFAAVTLAAALADVPARTFALATFIGLMPLSVVLASLGLELGRASSVGELVSPSVVGSLAALGSLALVPALVRRRRRRLKGRTGVRTRGKADDEPG